MALTRRRLLAGMAAGASRAAAQGRSANGPKPRTTPAVCLYSRALVKVPYDELGDVLRSLGVDGCDLSVEPGGHVTPEDVSPGVMRAIEAITGVGLDVFVVSTACTSLQDPTIRTIAGFAGEMGVPLFRAGRWEYGPNPEARLAEVQRDISGLAALARAAGMTVVLQNVAGENVGEALWDFNLLIRGMEPRTVGYDFDIGYATAEGGVGGWSVALRMVLPRLRMVSVRDFAWSKDSAGKWHPAPCPLGEGMVNWGELFAALARVRFAGPISIQVDYQPKDEIAAVRQSVAFVRKHLSAAYGTG